jgi:hypothetical protein
MIRVVSTQDVSLTLLDEFREDLKTKVDLDIDRSQYFFKSAAPPSWIAFFAEPSWWITVFGSLTALYVAEIVREAGKATWKNKKVIAAAIRSAGQSALRIFAQATWRLRLKMTPRTGFAVGLLFPDLGTRLGLELNDEETLEVQFALFVHHMPALAKLIRSEQLDNKAFGSIGLRLLDDGSLEATWIDVDTERERRQVIPLDAA